MAQHEKPSTPHADFSNEAPIFRRIMAQNWDRVLTPVAPSPGFQEDAAGFARNASDENPTLAESERHALDLWRRWRAALRRCEALDRQLDQARAAIPETLRCGRKYVGARLTEEEAKMTVGWPAISGIAAPPDGKINIRPGPQDLVEDWRGSIRFSYTVATDASSLTRQAHQARVFEKFIADVAALGERVRAQREAERAVNYREIEAELERASDARFDLASQIYALDCRGPHAIAAVTLLRLNGVDADDEDADRGPNASFWRAILAVVLPRLTGELADDAARALVGRGD